MTCCLPYECRVWHPAAQGLTLSYLLGPFPPLVLRLLGGVLLPRFSSPKPGQQWDELKEQVSPLLGS